MIPLVVAFEGDIYHKRKRRPDSSIRSLFVSSLSFVLYWRIDKLEEKEPAMKKFYDKTNTKPPLSPSSSRTVWSGISNNSF